MLLPPTPLVWQKHWDVPSYDLECVPSPWIRSAQYVLQILNLYGNETSAARFIDVVRFVSTVTAAKVGILDEDWSSFGQSVGWQTPFKLVCILEIVICFFCVS